MCGRLVLSVNYYELISSRENAFRYPESTYNNFEDKKSIILDCEHKYHLDCIDSWFKDYNKNCVNYGRHWCSLNRY